MSEFLNRSLISESDKVNTCPDFRNHKSLNVNATVIGRLAVFFDRLGPYHWARLEGAGKMGSILGVELFGSSKIYAWDKVDKHGHFVRKTLFPSQSREDVSLRVLRESIFKFLDVEQPKFVATPGWSEPGSLAVLEWCLRHDRRAILMSESTAFDHKRWPIQEWLKKCVIRMFTTALVGGRHHIEYLCALGMPVDRIHLGYDAVENDHFHKGAYAARQDDSRLRTALGLPKDYFLASARFVGVKNLELLLDAYARYRQSVLNLRSWGRENKEAWDLVLLGDGDLRPVLEQKCKALSLDDCVHLPGFKQYKELPAFYGLARVFVHVSTVEPWGLVVNEAMASGLPVIVSDRCGCGVELVRGGQNGFIIDPTNLEALAELMFEMWNGRFDLEAMGQKGQKVVSEWGPERFGQGLWHAADQVTKLPPPQMRAIDYILLRILQSRRKFGKRN